MNLTCQLSLVFLLASLALPALASPARPPNILVILADDLGGRDLGCYKSDTFYETPNLDRLAQQGMRFTDAYAANPVCSPTRFSLMTGRYPTRVGATDWFGANREFDFKPAPMIHYMPLEEWTLAEGLRTAGYSTVFVGKWHLGEDEKYWPEHQGFDINIAGWSMGRPSSYFSPYKNPRLSDGPAGEYLTERLTEEAIGQLRQLKDKPFLLYYSLYAVHTPLQAPAALVKKYEEKAKRLGLGGADDFGPEEQNWPIQKKREVRLRQGNPTYAAMVETMDTSVGRILAELETLGLAENTLVIFTSDNGGLSTAEGSPTSNFPLRGGKGWIYEGGIREPFLVRWPAHVKPGSTNGTPVMSIDVLPTVFAAAGAPLPKERPMDGRSLVPLLQGGQAPDRDALYWHYPHYGNQGGFPGGAIRVGNWKLIERFTDGCVHLYNLSDDIGEQRDLVSAQPEQARALLEKLHAWYQETGAKFLEPQPGGPMPWRP